MGEIWAAAAVTVIGGVVAGKAAESKDKSDKAHDKAMTKEESRLAAQRTSHQMALEDYYSQKNRARKQRGLDQYRQFSTMQETTPGYDPTGEVRIDEGTAPTYEQFDENPVNVGAKQNKGGKSLSDIHKKVRDPLGVF